MKQCQACGMPLAKKEDFSQGDENADFCVYCTNADGSVKTCQEIFEGGANFFMESLEGDKETAEKITRKNMSMLPHWQGSDCECLKGDMATDEEFATFMKRLMPCCSDGGECGEDCKCGEDCECHEHGCECCHEEEK